MNSNAAAGRLLLTFILLVFLLSLPFWLVGALITQLDIPINLPVSALQAVNPLIAALILVYRENGSAGIRSLLKRTFDFRRINNKVWYLAIIFLWPVTMLLSYFWMRITGAPLPDPKVPLLMVPVFLIPFFISGAAEELGWQGFLWDRMKGRWSALAFSVVVGFFWGLWHVLPLTQANRPQAWIFWQVLGMVPFRILIVWLYNNTGQSVFAASLVHAMSNVSQFLFPNYASNYDPFYPFVILTILAAIVILLWGPRTLASYRFARFSSRASDLRS